MQTCPCERKMISREYLSSENRYEEGARCPFGSSLSWGLRKAHTGWSCEVGKGYTQRTRRIETGKDMESVPEWLQPLQGGDHPRNGKRSPDKDCSSLHRIQFNRHSQRVHRLRDEGLSSDTDANSVDRISSSTGEIGQVDTTHGNRSRC